MQEMKEFPDGYFDIANKRIEGDAWKTNIGR